MAYNNLPLVFCILDGWGCSIGNEYDAIHVANTPCWDNLLKLYPNCKLSASGKNVGLPEGQMGNSEVGHMTIGAGRIIEQDLTRINRVISSNELAKNIILQDFISCLKKQKGVCHIMGLLSDGGVHSHYSHIIALAKIISGAGLKVRLHAFLDGRDVLPVSAAKYIADFKSSSFDIEISTISGRYYAMDRDNNWDRTKKCYDAIAYGIGIDYHDVNDLLQNSYNSGITDEFVIPAVSQKYDGLHGADGILIANFRAERVRQIASALVKKNFLHFETKRKANLALSMTQYSEDLGKLMKSIFVNQRPNMTLGKAVSNAGLSQLRIAETEKYAHVTYFLNCGVEKPLPKENRILIPSPKVATYDLKPEMSAFDIKKQLIDSIKSKKFDFIVVNFANADMVGHTGNLKAAVKAVSCIDQCISEIIDAILPLNGMVVISADHGNAEKMFDGDSPCVSHTTSDVPFVIVSNDSRYYNIKKNGSLSDIAPTLLNLINIKIPEDMKGKSLLS